MRATSHHAKQSALDFHRLMKELLTSMQIKPSPNAEPEVYSFTFDGKTEINIFSTRPGMLDVLVKLGVLNNRKAHATLLNLLAMNRYGSDPWPLNIGVDPVSGMTTLWTRQPLLHLEPDGLTALLKHILDKAASVCSHLQGNSSMPAKGIPNGDQRGVALKTRGDQLAGPR